MCVLCEFRAFTMILIVVVDAWLFPVVQVAAGAAAAPHLGIDSATAPPQTTTTVHTTHPHTVVAAAVVGILVVRHLVALGVASVAVVVRCVCVEGCMLFVGVRSES